MSKEGDTDASGLAGAFWGCSRGIIPGIGVCAAQRYQSSEFKKRGNSKACFLINLLVLFHSQTFSDTAQICYASIGVSYEKLVSACYVAAMAPISTRPAT